MDRLLCHRCLRRHRPGASFCATCGCAVTHRQGDKRSIPSPPSSSRSSWLLTWMFTAACIFILTRDAGPPRGGLASTPDSQLRPNAHGLIFDMPADYPADHFLQSAR